MEKITQKEIVMEYFTNNLDRAIEHPEVVDWVVAEYRKRTGEVFRDPDRQIRQLHQSGFLIKVKKGVYKYDPQAVAERELEDFTQQQKQAILERGGYKCAVCGRHGGSGVELHVDHLRPKDQGGKATLNNGQVLCGEHNYRKKNFGQTEMAKKMFLNLYEKAKADGDEKVLRLCTKILTAYEEEDVNGHIEWKR